MKEAKIPLLSTGTGLKKGGAFVSREMRGASYPASWLSRAEEVIEKGKANLERARTSVL